MSWIGGFITAKEEGDPARQVVANGAYADRFGGQLVLVTGAAGGIGRATAFAFAEAGARSSPSTGTPRAQPGPPRCPG